MRHLLLTVIALALVGASGCRTTGTSNESPRRSQLRSIVLEQVSFENATLDAVLRHINFEIGRRWQGTNPPCFRYVLPDPSIAIVASDQHFAPYRAFLLHKYNKRYTTGTKTNWLPKVSLRLENVSAISLLTQLANGLSQSGVAITAGPQEQFGETALEMRAHKVPKSLIAAGSFGVGLDPESAATSEDMAAANLFMSGEGMLLRIDTRSGHMRFAKVLRKFGSRMKKPDYGIRPFDKQPEPAEGKAPALSAEGS